MAIPLSAPYATGNLRGAVAADGHPSLNRREQRALNSARRLSKLMDAQWRLGPFRFGLETVADVLPGVGDLTALAVSLYQLGVAGRLGLPRGRRFRMGLNVGIDAVAGAVPLLGDLADTAFKVHVRNQRIIDKYLDEYLVGEQRDA